MAWSALAAFRGALDQTKSFCALFLQINLHNWLNKFGKFCSKGTQCSYEVLLSIHYLSSYSHSMTVILAEHMDAATKDYSYFTSSAPPGGNFKGLEWHWSSSRHTSSPVAGG